MSVIRQLSGLRFLSTTGIRSVANAAQAATTESNKFYDVPEGHVNSDLSSTICNIGLNRRRDLTLGAAGEIRVTLAGERFRLADVLKEKNTVLFGIPDLDDVSAKKQIAGYLKKANEMKKLGYPQVLCVAADADATAAIEWGKRAGLGSETVGLAVDTNGGLTRLLGMEVEDQSKSLGIRSQRYAILLENGVVLRVGVEAKPGEVSVTSADEMIKTIKDLQK